MKTYAYSIIPRHRIRIRINSFFFRTLLQVGDPNEDSVSEPTLTEPDHELVVDTTSPPEEIKKRAVELIKELKGEDEIGRAHV